jgi:hypothetical protein
MLLPTINPEILYATQPQMWKDHQANNEFFNHLKHYNKEALAKIPGALKTKPKFENRDFEFPESLTEADKQLLHDPNTQLVDKILMLAEKAPDNVVD